MHPTPEHSFYELIGEETAVRELVNRFYDLMDSLPEAYEIRRLHGENLENSREKLFKFLSGWLGGPPLYMEQYGHPKLRQRHLPFPIDTKARDQWLLCMSQAMEDMQLDKALKIQLEQAFFKTADFMCNRG